MGAAEDLVNNAAGASVNQENRATGPTENPIVSDQRNVGQIPASELAASAGNVANNQAAATEIPAKDQVAGGAENPVIDLLGVPQNPASEPAGSAENLLIDLAVGAENIANHQAAEGADHPTNGQAAGGAENLLIDLAGGAENPVNNKVGASENAVNDKAGGVENSSSNQTNATKCFVNGEQDPAAGLVEDEVDAVAIETPGNCKANAAETPVSYTVDHLPEEAKEILKSLASKWEDVLDADALQVIPQKGAMTNEVFQIKWPTTTGEMSRKVLVRIYGEGVDVFFDRDHEIRTFELMSKNGQGPRLLGRFTNGRVEEFICARVI